MFSVGMQHGVIGPEAWGLGLDEITIAQRLKTLNYTTHIVGKVGVSLMEEVKWWLA